MFGFSRKKSKKSRPVKYRLVKVGDKFYVHALDVPGYRYRALDNGKSMSMGKFLWYIPEGGGLLPNYLINQCGHDTEEEALDTLARYIRQFVLGGRKHGIVDGGLPVAETVREWREI